MLVLCFNIGTGSQATREGSHKMGRGGEWWNNTYPVG